MLKIYNSDLKTNKFEEVKEIKKGCWINLVKPNEDEIKKICEETKINDEFIRYSLDMEEKPRVDIDEDENTILFILDVPIIEKESKGNYLYTTMPLGIIFVRDDFFITVALRNTSIIEKFEKRKVKSFSTYMKSRFLFQIMLENSSEFLYYLKRINRETDIAESTLKNSMKNKELLKMLSLEKSLVYFTTSINSNEAVMERTLRGKFIKLYEDDDEILDDAIIENKQAMEMGKIYSDILNGTMDAYASIISNNLNVVMRFLTSITIVLAIPTMVSSFWGMNVHLPFQENALGFWIMLGFSIILTLIVIWWLKRKDMLD